jgi:endonuclease YncB( thermonuclease family)
MGMPLDKAQTSKAKIMRRIILKLVGLLAFSSVALTAEISGKAMVVDGDTIDVGEARIRIHGIDAPESKQVCETAQGPWFCGKSAADALVGKVNAQIVVCENLGRDRYKRILGRCWIEGHDLGAWMVSSGLALAFRRYSLDYVGEEKSAKDAKRGIWASEFLEPWEWRKAFRSR